MMDIEKLDPKQFAIVFSKLLPKVKENPIDNFIKARGFIDFIPSAAQEVILKVIFNSELDPVSKKLMRIEVTGTDSEGKDTLHLIEVPMTEVEIFKHLTGIEYIKNDAVKNKINLICGRRSGKTTICSIIALYCAIATNWRPFLRKTPYATVLILSHTTDFSNEIIELIRTMIENSPILSRLINKDKKNTASTINLKVPFIENGKIEYSRVQIRSNAASSKSTRGVAACAVILDEIAFFNLDENMKETDEKILKAVRPAMKQFGKFGMLFKLSSPGIKQGVLYGEYKRWIEKTLPDSYVIFKAASWELNMIVPTEEFIEEYELDKDGFDTEYRSNFADSLSNFILPDFIDMAIIKNTKFLAPEGETVRYHAAIDAAFKKDQFTFSVVAFHNNRVRQYVTKGWKGSKKEPVNAHEVAEYVKTVCKQYNIDEVAADQYAFQPLREIFDRYGVSLKEYTFVPIFKRKIYFNLKKLFHSQQIDLLDVEIQTKELKELIVEQTGSGTIRIGHPISGTDDYADSLAIAAYLATEGLSTTDFVVTSNSSGAEYGIQVDVNGKSFSAPTVDLLTESGHLPPDISDNSKEYWINPKTGKLEKRADNDDEPDDGTNFIF